MEEVLMYDAKDEAYVEAHPRIYMVEDLLQIEWENWREFFKETASTFNLTEETLNEQKYKTFFDAVKRWGDSLVELRQSLR